MQLISALVCPEPGRLQIEKRPALKAESGKVLVRPRRVGICGTDYHIFEGKHPFLRYPRVMGHELAVEIVEAPRELGFETGEICVVNPYLSCGECVACLAGKPNCCIDISVLGVHQDGGMADLLNVPAGNLIKVQGLSMDECAAVEFLAIGAHAVRRGSPTKDDDVLIVGAGPIGLGTALFARLTGARVAITDRDTRRARVTAAITGTKTLPANGEFGTDRESFDIVFDATGSQQAMEKGFDLVAHGGKYVLVGVIRANITFADPDFHSKEMTLFGSRNALRADFEQVIKVMRDGEISVEKLITHRTTLAGAVQHLPVWATEKTGLIKAMIEID